MIAISSHRPHSESGEYRDNQIRAHDSWYYLFDKIIYLGPDETDLKDHKTLFVPSEPFPLIYNIAKLAAQQEAYYVTLVNADIVLMEQFEDVLVDMQHRKKTAGLSKRHAFDPPKIDFGNAPIEDFGLDIFVATPVFWARVAKSIPRNLRIGHPRWDTWMYGFFLTILKAGLCDFSNYHAVYHPRHSGRVLPYAGETDVNDKYTRFAGLPVPFL